MLTRLRRREDGFAMVTAVAVLAIMSILLVVVLTAGNSAFDISERNSRFTRTLAVAEAGLDDVAVLLGGNRSAPLPCAVGSSTACAAAGGGEYQASWTMAPDGVVTVTSIGYYPTMAQAQISRRIEAVFEPVPSFRYALYSATSLAIKNNEVVMGDIWANGPIQLGTGAIVCGSLTSATGGVELLSGAMVVKSYIDGATGKECYGKSGNVWANGVIKMGPPAMIEGDATASAPTGLACPPTPDTNYAILGGEVQGQATACGRITATTTAPSPNTATDPPALGSIPTFTFDPNNYTSINCIPLSTPCEPAITSGTAVSQFNALSRVNMSGVYAIWQTNPTQATVVNLTELQVGGDLTIITNAPIYFGNTNPIPSTGPAMVTIVSLYIPPPFTTCDAGGGDCSIFGQNNVLFDSGDPLNPNDGIVSVVYTPGKMAFKNTVNGGEGVLYAGSMDIKNGFRIAYNPRAERMVGFGGVLERTLWQEISE